MRVRRRARRDHPRSRGVYTPCSAAWASRAGSSPLARGLQPAPTSEPAPAGIIPARAGFTDPAVPRRRRRQDHPRSRGVYASALASLSSGSGSSPLARGLPPTPPPHGAGDGIIPARAGFTGSWWFRGSSFGDHPRSRGVYRNPPRSVFSITGSSPLARGLHLRILGIPTNPYSTRPLPPSLPTRGPFRRVARAPPSFGAPPAADGRDLEDADATRPPRVSDPGSDTAPTCAGEWRRRPARSGSRRSGGSAPPRSRG